MMTAKTKLILKNCTRLVSFILILLLFALRCFLSIRAEEQ